MQVMVSFYARAWESSYRILEEAEDSLLLIVC